MLNVHMFVLRFNSLTKKLHDKYPTGEFPKNAMMRPSVSRVYSPSLEFVKMVTRALSIDSNISEYINNKLKRDLLKLCGVGAFSEAAQWNDPCLSFTLSQVCFAVLIYISTTLESIKVYQI